MKNCVAVLTRGYTNISSYQKLIRRNTQISKNLNNKDIDYLIFHEGNISEEHQTYIQEKTPELRLIFINVDNGVAFKKEKEIIVHSKESSRWGNTGYRHMCAFWFTQFLEFTKEYDKLLRIDEDCYIDFSVDQQFETLDKYIFVCGRWEKENYPFVTRGLLQVSIDIFKCENHILYGPYTNVTGFNLQKIRDTIQTTRIINDYIDSIYKLDGIYEHRWGDHVLWGELIVNFFGMDSIKIDILHYFHESHNLQL
jgi:hypothetical protein